MRFQRTLDQEPAKAPASPSDYPVYYFFYGTLTAPSTLKWIPDLPKEPVFCKAQITGYALGKWGDYFALIEGEQDQVVSGYAYQVQSEAHAQKLAYYETSTYKVHDCQIRFTDDNQLSELDGKTFMYAGDKQALLEQRFDRKLWEIQMGGKLK